MKKLGILDSGEFSDRTGLFSSPRIFATIRDFASRRDLTIEKMQVVASRKSDPLPGESHLDRAKRDLRKLEVEYLRVERTAITTFGLDPKQIKAIEPEALTDEMSDLDMILIVMRPSRVRSELIINSAKLVESVVVYPPYFSNISQIQEIQENLDNAVDRIKLWLPYRYSVASREILERFSSSKGKRIAAVQLTVHTSPYPSSAFISEYSLPFIDLLTVIAGSPLHGTINFQLVDGLPILGMQIWHDNNSTVPVLSSSLLTTAGGALQHMEPGFMIVHATQPENIQTIHSFTGIIHRKGTGYNEVTDVSHDASAAELTGYSVLLKKCIENGWEQDERQPTPTLESFESIQLILDQLLAVDLSAINSPGTRAIGFKRYLK